MRWRAAKVGAFAALMVFPLILGVALHESDSIRAADTESWRIDREICNSCGSCVGMYSWIFEEGEDGFPRFIDPNECGIVYGNHQDIIRVGDPNCQDLMHEIDDSLPFDECFVPCN